MDRSLGCREMKTRWRTVPAGREPARTLSWSPLKTDHDSSTDPQAGAVRRILLLGLGALFTALAAVGAFLPVLPTTPFLILAGACFVRSSPRLHQKLLQNRLFGPYLTEWHEDRTVPLEAKRKAYGLVVLSFGFSIYMVEAWWLRGLLVVTALLLLRFLIRLPITGEGRQRSTEVSPLEKSE